MFLPDETRVFLYFLKNKGIFLHIQKVTSRRDDFYSKTSKRLNSMRQKLKTKKRTIIWPKLLTVSSSASPIIKDSSLPTREGRREYTSILQKNRKNVLPSCNSRCRVQMVSFPPASCRLAAAAVGAAEAAAMAIQASALCSPSPCVSAPPGSSTSSSCLSPAGRRRSSSPSCSGAAESSTKGFQSSALWFCLG